MARVKRQEDQTSGKPARGHGNPGKPLKRSSNNPARTPSHKPRLASKSIKKQGVVEKLNPLMEATKFLIWLEKQLPEKEAENTQGSQGSIALSANPRLSWVVGQYYDSLPEHDGIGNQSSAGRAAAIRSMTAVIRKGLKEIES